QKETRIVEWTWLLPAHDRGVPAPLPSGAFGLPPRQVAVQVDVTAHVANGLGVCGFPREEAVADEVALARPAVHRVDPSRILAVKLAQPLRKPAGGELDDEVVVVSLERPGERAPPVLRRRPVVELEEELTLGRVTEHRQSVHAARPDVDVPLGVQRWATRHRDQRYGPRTTRRRRASFRCTIGAKLSPWFGEETRP